MMLFSLRRLLSPFSSSVDASANQPTAGSEGRQSSPAAAAAAARTGDPTAPATGFVSSDSDSILTRINLAIDEVRPAIRMDGGDIELIGFQNGTATVKLKGACRSCPMSEMTLQLGVERVVREMVPEVERVEAV